MELVLHHHQLRRADVAKVHGGLEDDHLKDDLTNMEAVERIADHVARISQEYPAINIDNLPHEGQLKLNSRLDEMNFSIVDERCLQHD
jgi:hypothetical protein